MIYKIGIGLVILLFVLVPAVVGQHITVLVPPASELEGWKLVSGPEIYEGDRLYDLINGGADIYHEYGFFQVVSASYADPSQNLVQLEVYEMKDASSAFGIFSLAQQSTPWDTGFMNVSAVTNDYISFWKGKYYAIISKLSGHQQGSQFLSELAALVGNKITIQGNYPELVMLFKDSESDENIIFLGGNLALSNFYYFDYRDIFEIREGVAFTPGDHHRIIIRYPDEAKAQALLASSRQNISNNKRYTNVISSLQGYSCDDNKGNRILVRQIDNYIVIIIGLDEKLSLTPLMDEIEKKIGQ